MPVYEVEMRVVEIHTYRVVADSKEEAVEIAWDDPSPTYVEGVCYEVEDVIETKLKEDFVEFSNNMETINKTQELLAEIKEDIGGLREKMLSDSDYYDLRGENAGWLSGKANIGTEK